MILWWSLLLSSNSFCPKQYLKENMAALSLLNQFPFPWSIFCSKQHDSCDWVLDLDIVPPSAIFSFRHWQLSSSAAIFLHNDDTMKKSNVWKIIMILIKTAGNFQSNKHSACVTADDLQHTRHKYESNNFTFSRGVRKILLDVKKRDDGWYRNLPRMRRGFEFHWQCKRF